MFLYFFLLMENLGAMADSRYTGFPQITDCDVLDPHCICFHGEIRGEVLLISITTYVSMEQYKAGCF